MADMEAAEVTMNNNYELQHYGVLGMKWGKRKRVPDSPAVTRSKQRVAETKAKLKKEQKIYNKKTAYGAVTASPSVQKPYIDAIREHNYAKKDLGNTKILDKINAKPKSKSQLKLEAKYQKQGMTNDEAAVEAYKNIKTRNMLIAIGGTAVVVGGGYAAYKLHDSRVDKIIKSGTMIQNISGNDNKGVRDAFYASSNKLDRVKYQGIYGDTLIKNKGQAVKKEIKVLSDIKQASPKNAQKALEDLIKNDRQFARELTQYMNETVTQPLKFNVHHQGRFVKAAKAATSGKVDKNLYEAFNVALVDHDPKMQSLTDKYFSELTKRGYNAIKDVNDNKFSGYKALNPIIAFNAKGKIDVVDVAKLTNEQVSRSKTIGYAHILGTEAVKLGAVYTGGIVAANKLGDVTVSSLNNKQASQYRKQHPGTKMSNTEIIRMIERSR